MLDILGPTLSHILYLDGPMEVIVTIVSKLGYNLLKGRK